MLKLICMVCMTLATLPAFSQSANYQVGTIAAVKPHKAMSGSRSDLASYDVTVRVGDRLYVVLYTPPLGAGPIKYATGRSLLVEVEGNTLRYNNLLGESLEVPIIGRDSVTDAKHSVQGSEAASTK